MRVIPAATTAAALGVLPGEFTIFSAAPGTVISAPSDNNGNG